jgi:cation diffusion facilitator family transporter
LKLTEFILSNLIPDYPDLKDQNVRTKYGYLEAWASIIINSILFGAKFILGLVINSIALLADSFHTLSDVLTSIVVFIGFRVSKRPADKTHPFGHGRMESVATLIISVLLVVVGWDFAKRSFFRLFNPPIVMGSFLVVGVMLISALIKEWMTRFSIDLGKRINSSTLIADAWHHRSDAIASGLIAIAILGTMLGFHLLDAIFGIGVSLFIIYTGLKIGRSCVSYLLGEAPSKELIKRIKSCANSIPGVKGVHEVVVHDYGGKTAVSLHIEIDKKTDLDKAHKIATSVENKIIRETAASPIVHVDLKERGTQKRSLTDVEKYLNEIISSFLEVISYHAVEIVTTEVGSSIDLHIIVSRDMSVEDSHHLNHRLISALQGKLKDYKLNLHIEPCDGKCSGCSFKSKNLCLTSSHR